MLSSFKEILWNAQVTKLPQILWTTQEKKKKKKKKHLYQCSKAPLVGIRGESPPSFCNGLGTIYIASLWGMTFWSYYQRYGFGI